MPLMCGYTIEYSVCGDGGVHRTPTRLECFYARLGRQRVRSGDHTPIGQRQVLDSLSSGQFIVMVFRTFTRLMRKDLNIFSRPIFWAAL